MSVVIRLWRAVDWRVRKFLHAARRFPTTLAAWLALYRGISRYTVIDEAAVRATRKSDTIFIFGSGYSLNDITPEGWREIARHDTLGFNFFVHQNFIRMDYHLVREVARQDIGDRWKADAAEYFGMAKASPHYANTIYLVQSGFRAINGNRVIGHGFMPVANRVFLWRTIIGQHLPSESIDRGLVHGQGTLAECINFAALMGWKRIVLAGVDLYDRRYFWLPKDQPREMNNSVDVTHSTALNGLVELMRDWKAYYDARGIELYVHNPRSLLAQVMPVWPQPPGDRQ